MSHDVQVGNQGRGRATCTRVSGHFHAAYGFVNFFNVTEIASCQSGLMSVSGAVCQT